VVTSRALSDDLESCLQDEDLTLGRVNDVLDERGIALVLMLLLVPSALPVPTGGVTHVLEACALAVGVQMAVGRRELWLPRRVARHRLGDVFTKKAAPRLLRFIRWFERYARPRGARLLGSQAVVSLLGVVMLVFVLGAVFAPPFSGLDTLPSLGVVLVCLGVILRDGLVVVGGLVVGVAGIALVVVLGAALWSLL
jgi:hypothetical protein